MQQFIEALRRQPTERLLFGDQALVHHVDRDLHSGAGGALGDAALEEIETALLECELDIHHVVVVTLERRADVGELLVERRTVLLELSDIGRRADAGYDVFALCVQ